jgi:hypothetical protein
MWIVTSATAAAAKKSVEKKERIVASCEDVEPEGEERFVSWWALWWT